MKTIISNIISLSVGITIGILSTRKYFEKKYQNIADCEIESVKNLFEKPKNNITKITDRPVRKALEKFRVEESYVDYAKIYSGTDGAKNRVVGDPSESTTQANKKKKSASIIISPEEFSDTSNCYKTLFYFSDRVLTDEDYNIITDYSGIIDQEVLDSVMETGDDDVVYSRNEKNAIDYEILLDERSYYGLRKFDNPKHKLAETIDHADEDEDDDR